MPDAPVVTAPNERPARSANALCFIVDEDFVFRRELAKELRREGIDSVEFSNGSRFLEMVEGQNPDLVLLNLNASAPHECVRALLALNECRYSGAVQLFGNCEAKMLESFKTIGTDISLEMLAPIQKPLKVATIRMIIRERNLGNTGSAPAAAVSLKTALERNMVKFLYQPKIDLKTAMVSGAEAVARVADPRFGYLTPDQFLKGADEEAMLSLSRTALVHALKASAHFHTMGVRLPLAINIGIDNLLALPIGDLVMMHRPECTDWAGIILEIPERQVNGKIELLRARAPKLAQHGVAIAIDNFGQGSFSLNVLNRLPFSEIKIDRSLVTGCASISGNAKICKTLIQMAHNFGCRAVAVGIAEEADFHAISQLGCDVGQGFLLGKPMNVPEIDALITKYTGQSARAH